MSLKELEHGGTKKETRIRSLIPRFESKSIFFIGDSSVVEDEMRVFPRGLHDDVLDSLAYQAQIAERPDTYQPDFNLYANANYG